MRALFVCLALLISVPGPLLAQSAVPPAPYANAQLPDPRQEAEAKELMETLRCVTCQSQSIADSDAAMAGDMRHQVRSRIAAGEEPEAIRRSMIARYGDYISYAPRMDGATWPLFLLPVILLLAVALLIWRRLGRGGKQVG
ncbi:cytochrome c-type biogenesis protein CcmH [Erythrobacter sp. 3-20A1M]|uniref:cytochrome c-type biogenesis protein n=1 Tax=Erythrobacter sp. 3-20A1M TaxID=2653850 RepID=UPI001BFCD514|nr:cytochrome c-type biogenesis protein [Erythrobacter sp. 3-20A1M]QWC57728.1 cytochrome c-type biogenesis protein CcmH [Erythrobacter sp. 3-20A1M]